MEIPQIVFFWRTLTQNKQNDQMFLCLNFGVLCVLNMGVNLDGSWTLWYTLSKRTLVHQNFFEVVSLNLFPLSLCKTAIDHCYRFLFVASHARINV